MSAHPSGGTVTEWIAKHWPPGACRKGVWVVLDWGPAFQGVGKIERGTTDRTLLGSVRVRWYTGRLSGDHNPSGTRVRLDQCRPATPEERADGLEAQLAELGS